MSRRSFGLLLSAIALLPGVGNAQSVDTIEMRRNLDILSRVLEEGLRVRETPGIFSINLGQVRNLYLEHQGALVEIRSPLASQRQRLNLDALNSSIQDLQIRILPLSAPDFPGEPPVMALRTFGLPDTPALAELNEKLESLDYTAVINSALRQASQSLRSLQEMGALDQQQLQQVQEETESLRDSLQAQQRELRELEQELRQEVEADEAQLEQKQDELEAAMTALSERMAALRESATTTAEELRTRWEAARQQQADNWLSEVASFEQNMYQLLCDYGTSMRELPDGQNLTVVLSGLGEAEGETQRPDKIHVIGKRDLQRCVAGDIDAAELATRSTIYSY